ncbi:MFS transporter [Nocardioides islandensis]|uniref:MFS transporter n=1 Tax=Nocardioides islandensis TaxID=433663 RepID=A0A930VHC3_9ACTN|nr:MFS transporter [Nocardioides islandensis]MBF4765631.1 MFS transporter [Nocardioides islandensis]
MSRRTPLYGFLVADAISLVGTRVSMIAIPWLVLTTTGSAAQTGLVAFAEMLPLVVVKALAGPLIDRIGARRVAITCDVLSMVVVGLVPLLHLAGVLSFPALLALVAVGGGLRGPGDGAKSAFVPALTAHAEVSLERTTGLASAIERTASFAGAAVAGALVALLGAANALVVDALSFGVCAAVFAWSTSAMRAEQVDERPVGTTYVEELREGWTFLRKDSVLVAMSGMVAVTNLLDLAFSAVLLPVWINESGYSVGVMGAYFAVWALSSAAGSAVAAWAAERLPRFQVYLWAFLVAGLPRFVLLALGVPWWVVIASCLVGGFASGFLNPILGAVFYERVPAAVMGRVTTINSALCWSLMPFGGLLGGVLSESFGIVAALLVVGFSYFAATMLPLAIPSFRSFDKPKQPALVGAA